MAKIGRNDPCPCGSGKKYKNCCRNLGEEMPSPEHLLELIEAGEVGADDPETITAIDRARALEAEGRLEEALEVLEVLPGEKRLFPGVALELSFLLRSLDRLEEAENYLELAEQLIPNHPLLRFHKACLLYRQGQMEAALSYLQGLNPDQYGETVRAKLQELERLIREDSPETPEEPS